MTRTRVGWLLEVCLRGVDTPILYTMADEASARSAALWFASTYMKKCPSDRSGAWLITTAASMQVLDGNGVGELTRHVVIAAIDPREVTAVSVDYAAVEERTIPEKDDEDEEDAA